MSCETLPCDLCMLPVTDKKYSVRTPEGDKHFCCEGCKGIYLLLNQIDETGQTDPIHFQKGEPT